MTIDPLTRHPQKHNDLAVSPPEFLPYQLMQWEDDIIYDAQLSSHKVAASARQNAAYAGWIPSTNYRTMATFQVRIDLAIFKRSVVNIPPSILYLIQKHF